jgi:acyl dehydratase
VSDGAFEIPTLVDLRACVGREFGPTEWFEVTQPHIDDFAAVTGDRNWIHVDTERAADGPYGRTIAHGHYTTSLVPMFLSQLMRIGFGRRLNYGSDKVRFPEPVPCGARLRARATIAALDEKDSGLLLRTDVVVEIEGSPRPACVTQSLRFIAPGPGRPRQAG